MMGTIDEVELIALAQAPQWVRRYLLSPVPVVRARAEETLAAMISSGLDESESEDPGSAAA